MKRRVLVVDDELSIVHTLKTVLEIYGFEVDTAISSEDAISRLKAGSYHLVISDLKMEHDTSGFDVLRAARNTEYQPAVAFLTAYPLKAQDWQNQGAQALLVKPMNNREMLRQIDALLAAHESRGKCTNLTAAIGAPSPQK